MFFFSTTYHLFVISRIEPLELEDVFIFTNEQDAQDLANLLSPKDTIIAGVMEMEQKSKLIWVCEHTLDTEKVSLASMLDMIHDSLNTFNEDFQSEWL
mgnify:CR=1 FL=1